MEDINLASYFLLFSALVCAAIANIDNRSPLGFFLLGLFLPPVAWIALAFTRKNEHNRTVFVDIVNGRKAKKPDQSDWMGSVFALTMGVIVFGALFYFS